MLAADDLDILTRLATATLCGGAIGLERDLRRMPTGFRTMAIVALGACVAAIAGLKTGDPAAFSRIAQGVVTGIGFLGAGVILQRGEKIRHVKGLTTAAAVWLTAVIGLLCGLGELKIAFAATALAVAVLMLDFIGEQIWPKPPKTPGGSGANRGGAPAGPQTEAQAEALLEAEADAEAEDGDTLRSRDGN